MGIICEEILMKFVYTSDKDDEIVKHEKIMLEKYSNIQQIGCLLKMGMSVVFIARYRKMVQKYV